MTTHRTEIRLTREQLLGLFRKGTLTLMHQATAAHSVHVDVHLVLDENMRSEATTRALVDALTDDLAHRYERGWNVEDCRYEPGSSEWVGMLVSNADRIQVTDSGMTLAEVNDEQKRLYVERLLKGETQHARNLAKFIALVAEKKET